MGTLDICVPYYNRDPKKGHKFDNHPSGVPSFFRKKWIAVGLLLKIIGIMGSFRALLRILILGMCFSYGVYGKLHGSTLLAQYTEECNRIVSANRVAFEV